MRIGPVAAWVLAAALFGMGGAWAQPDSALTGIDWSAEEVLGHVVRDAAGVTLRLDAAGRVAGSSGCNRFVGQVTFSDGSVRFGPLAGTRMACPPPRMELEQQVHRALEATRAFVLDGSRSKLRLIDGTGRALMVLTR